MPASEPWEVDVAALAPRPVARAGLLLGLTGAQGQETLAVRDAADGGFAPLPPVPPGWQMRALGLSPTGAAVVLWAHTLDGTYAGLCLVTLATGEQRWFADPERAFDYAAVSPDGGTIATLGGDGSASAGLLDVASGTGRGLWEGDGGAGAEGALSWSPDGRYLAVTYETYDEDAVATVVLDPGSGATVARYPGMQALPSPNGSWLGAGELVMCPLVGDEPVPPVVVAEVPAGRIRRYRRPGEWAGGCVAVLGGRLIQDLPDRGLYGTGLDGGDPRPFGSARPPYQMRLIDVIP